MGKYKSDALKYSPFALTFFFIHYIGAFMVYVKVRACVWEAIIYSLNIDVSDSMIVHVREGTVGNVWGCACVKL